MIERRLTVLGCAQSWRGADARSRICACGAVPEEGRVLPEAAPLSHRPADRVADEADEIPLLGDAVKGLLRAAKVRLAVGDRLHLVRLQRIVLHVPASLA